MQGESPSDRFERLSDGQRDCLRLVAEHRSSKEIARLLSVSPHTVDQRLKRATSILAVGSRFEAARLYLDHEREAAPTPSLYESLIYQRPDLHPREETRKTDLPPGERNPLGGGAANATLHEAQASYFTAFPPAATPSFRSVLNNARYENNLPPLWRLLIIFGIMLAGILGFAVLVNIVEGLSRITG